MKSAYARTKYISCTEGTVYQEGTWAPDDGQHRFMGAIAIDGSGNIGMAYSISGDQESPGIRFTGRRASDPLGQMTVDEYNCVSGGSNQNDDRFGDYAQMGVDPANERTFWYSSSISTNTNCSPMVCQVVLVMIGSLKSK